MSVNDIVILLGAGGTFLTMFGGGARWGLTYIDRKAAEGRAEAEVARKELKDHLEAEILRLEDVINRMDLREGLYLRRVLQLEAFIQGQKGMVMPSLEGWPPR